METTAYKVRVVVDRQFGERLAALEHGVPVWIVGSETNKLVALRLWRERPADHLTGITVFNDSADASSEEVLVSELDTIDVHHGRYSANPPYTVLEVIGASLSSRVRTALSEYGFNEFTPSTLGFTATRPIPGEEPP